MEFFVLFSPLLCARVLCYDYSMTNTLTPDLEAFVRDEVAAGRYSDEAEVIRDAVRRLADLRDVVEAGKLDALRAALSPGLADVAAGRFAQGGVMDAAARAAAE
jgi:putative addiction module CopG family antidote